MSTQLERFVALREAVKRRGGLRKVLFTTVAVAGTWLVGKVIDHYTDGLIGRAVDWLAHQFGLLAMQPIGIVGLLFLIALCGALLVVLFLAWWDSRPRPALPAMAKRLSPEEWELVYPIRRLWNLYGGNACNAAANLLDQAVIHMRGKQPELYWAPLLVPVIGGMRESFGLMSEAAAENSFDPVVVLRERFNKAQEAYACVVRWLVNIHGRAVDLGKPPFDYQLSLWKRAQDDFHKELEKVLAHPDHKNTLLFPVFESERYKALVAAAPDNPE